LIEIELFYIQFAHKLRPNKMEVEAVVIGGQYRGTFLVPLSVTNAAFIHAGLTTRYRKESF